MPRFEVKGKVNGEAKTFIVEAAYKSEALDIAFKKKLAEISVNQLEDDGWYIKREGNKLGPLSDTVLREYAKSQRLTPDDLVRYNADGEWTQASGIQGLFGASPQLLSPPSASSQRPVSPYATPTNAAPISIPCKTCDNGTMQATKLHRFSGPSIAIGYILLIPSVFGILFSFLFIVSAAANTAVTDVEKSASVFVVGFGFALAAAAFVSGLTGWLLIMKKEVLQCQTCRAVVNTS